MAGDFGYAKFKETPRGQECFRIIEAHKSEMEVLAKHGVSPVRAIDMAMSVFEQEKGKQSFAERQHCGRMVFEVLGTTEYEVSGRDDFKGVAFSSGATYVRRSAKPITIRRKSPRPGGDEYPIRSTGGYQLVPPGLTPEERTLAANAVMVRKLEAAIPLLDMGFHIRMGRKGVRPSLIGKDSLIIE